VTRQDLVAVFGGAVDRRGRRPARRTVTDQPAEVVGELLRPHLRQTQLAGVIALGVIGLDVVPDRDRPLGVDRRGRQVEGTDTVVGGEAGRLDIPTVGGEDPVPRRAAQLHAVVEAQSDDRVAPGDHERLGGRQHHLRTG
jgi:hypothetical protein